MVSSRSPSDVLHVVSIAHKLQGKGLFARDTALHQRALVFVNVREAPGAQHNTIARGQGYRLELGPYRAQRVELSQAAPIARENIALECNFLVTHAHGLLGRPARQALL